MAQGALLSWGSFGSFDPELLTSFPKASHKAPKGQGEKSRKVVEWSSAVARALNFLHSRKMIHRDLKPMNLLLTKHNEVKVSDFGISRMLAEADSYNMTGGIGTWRYMAPEVVRHESYDEKVDIYALGLIMYFMSSGRAPFHHLGYEAKDILVEFRKGREPRPLAAECSPSLRPLAVAAWHVNPEKRPSARELLQKLRHVPQKPGLSRRNRSSKRFQFSFRRFNGVHDFRLGSRTAEEARRLRALCPDVIVVIPWASCPRSYSCFGLIAAYSNLLPSAAALRIFLPEAQSAASAVFVRVEATNASPICKACMLHVRHAELSFECLQRRSLLNTDMGSEIHRGRLHSDRIRIAGHLSFIHDLDTQKECSSLAHLAVCQVLVSGTGAVYPKATLLVGPCFDLKWDFVIRACSTMVMVVEGTGRVTS